MCGTSRTQVKIRRTRVGWWFLPHLSLPAFRRTIPFPEIVEPGDPEWSTYCPSHEPLSKSPVSKGKTRIFGFGIGDIEETENQTSFSKVSGFQNRRSNSTTLSSFTSTPSESNCSSIAVALAKWCLPVSSPNRFTTRCAGTGFG